VLGRLSLCLWVFYILKYVQVVPLPGKGMGCVATRKGFHKPNSKELDKNVQQPLSDIVFVIFAAILPFSGGLQVYDTNVP
jgi:hypothetical protein